MSKKKKKVLGALMCAGLALGVFGGGTIIASAHSGNTTSSATASVIQETAERQTGICLPHGGNNGRQQLTEEQIAAFEAYAELSKEIYQDFNEKYAALVSEYKAKIEEVYASVLGEPYIQLQAEYNGLYGQYQGLVNGFYESEEYTGLKADLDELITALAATEKNSEEYFAVMSEINAVWGKISVLAGEVNSQISLIRSRATEITAEIRALINQNNEALKAALDPVIAQFNAEAQALQASLAFEFEVLRASLGIS